LFGYKTFTTSLVLWFVETGIGGRNIKPRAGKPSGKRQKPIPNDGIFKLRQGVKMA